MLGSPKNISNKSCFCQKRKEQTCSTNKHKTICIYIYISYVVVFVIIYRHIYGLGLIHYTFFTFGRGSEDRPEQGWQFLLVSLQNNPTRSSSIYLEHMEGSWVWLSLAVPLFWVGFKRKPQGEPSFWASPQETHLLCKIIYVVSADAQYLFVLGHVPTACCNAGTCFCHFRLLAASLLLHAALQCGL